MPQLDVTLEPSSRKSADAIQLHITNRTGLFLLGAVSIGAASVNLWPFKPDFTSMVALPPSAVKGETTTIVINLRSEVELDLSIREEIELRTSVFPCFKIDVTQKGSSVETGVQISWDAGSPAITPTVWAKDGKGKRHPLNWGPLLDDGQGLTRECYVTSGLKSLAISGEWTHDGTDHEIDEITLDVEDADCGVFRLVRGLVPTAEEIAERKRLEKAKQKRLAKEEKEKQASIEAALKIEQEYFDAQIEAQKEGEANADAAAEARTARAVAAYEVALAERAIGTAVKDTDPPKPLTPEEQAAKDKADAEAEAQKQKEFAEQAYAMANAAENAAKEQAKWDAAQQDRQREGEEAAEAAAQARAQRFQEAYEAAKPEGSSGENEELQRQGEAQAEEAAKARAERFKQAYAQAMAERAGLSAPAEEADSSGDDDSDADDGEDE